MPIGHPGVFRVREKILMFFHLTRTNMPPPSPGIEPLSVVVPIVYDIETNQTSIPQKDQININNPVMIGAQQILVNLANSGNFSIFLLNLTHPNEEQIPKLTISQIPKFRILKLNEFLCMFQGI